jgi:hypothetical protein
LISIECFEAFWWGSKEGKRKTCWVSWEKMCSPKYEGGLGFRDIELFNLSKLARQAWRILENPEALSSRILKAVYFPSSDFLDATLGSSPSQVWRALLEGRDVMRQGIIKRIGTAENTNVWNENWLPRDFMMRLVSCIKRDPPMTVAAFIDSTTATWRVDLFQQFYLLMDVAAICAIPRRTRRMTDVWAWQYEKNGILSARSVYRLLVQTKKRWDDWLEERPAVSNTEGEQKSWQRLWLVQVPSKLGIFLWRLSQQSLLIGDVRFHRYMVETSICSICGAADSWRHSLLSCSVARCVLALANEGITEHVCMNEDPSARNWLFAMMETLLRDDFARVAVTLWAIWYARKRIIHEGEFQSPLSTHMFIENYLRDLSIAGTSSGKISKEVPKHSRWLPPREGTVKLNVDAAMAKDGRGGVVGVVCTDGAGVFGRLHSDDQGHQ